MNDFYEKLKTALNHTREQSLRSTWLNIEPVDFFVRFSQIPFELGPNLQLANVSIDPEYQKKGHFTKLLSCLERYAQEHGFEAVYLENVLNKGLYEFLKKKEYWIFYKEGMAAFPPCYYKRIKVEK